MADLQEIASLLGPALAQTPGALERLLTCLREHVRQRSLRFLAPLDASDAAQEVALKIADHLDQLRGQQPEQLLAWVEQILRNHVRDRWRHEGADKRNVSQEVPGNELFSGLAGDSTSPDDRAARNEEQERLLIAIEKLPERERRVVRLRLVEGRSSAEAAEELGASEGNIRVILFRAVARLREQMGEHP